MMVAEPMVAFPFPYRCCRWALSMWLLLGPACTSRDTVANATGTSGPGGAAGAAGAGGAGATGGSGAAGQTDYCQGSGPPIVVGDTQAMGPAACGGRVAERTFRFAVCTCEGYTTSTSLTTDSFDSRQGPWAPGHSGGSVGANGPLDSNAALQIGGSLWVSGGAGVRAAIRLEVASDLEDAGPLFGGGQVTIRRDAYVAGDVTLGSLSVGGRLVVPAGRTISAPAGTVATTERAGVQVAPPCACAPTDLVDIASFVAARRTDHDDARIGLDPARLARLSGPTTLELPCGRYYVDAIGGDGALTLRIAGRTALFVGGNADLRRAFHVELSPGAELDLFIAGTLSAADEVRLGAPEQPARARLYVGGAGTLALAGGTLLGGNLYAPGSELQLSGGAEVFGSLFVRRLVTSAPLTVHYDTAVLDAGSECPGGPPTNCSTCLDCRNQACLAGHCGACTDSSQCCAPLLCFRGQCLPEIG